MGTLLKSAFLFSLGLTISGCASIIKGTNQSIAISTPPTTGALCNLSNDDGNWELTSPGVASVHKSSDDIQIRCTKAGWQDAASTIPSNFQAWTVGNLVFGGLIGLGVDAATGAINEYPHSFQVPMTPLSAPGGGARVSLNPFPSILAADGSPPGFTTATPAALASACGAGNPCPSPSSSVPDR